MTIIKSRTGFLEPAEFDVLWEQFVAALQGSDPQAFYVNLGQERLDAPLDELKQALRAVSIKRNSQP